MYSALGGGGAIGTTAGGTGGDRTTGGGGSTITGTGSGGLGGKLWTTGRSGVTRMGNGAGVETLERFGAGAGGAGGAGGGRNEETCGLLKTDAGNGTAGSLAIGAGPNTAVSICSFATGGLTGAGLGMTAERRGDNVVGRVAMIQNRKSFARMPAPTRSTGVEPPSVLVSEEALMAASSASA